MWPLLLLLVPSSVLSVPAFQKCVNGTLTDGQCVCNYGFTGHMCHREMHCDTFDRDENGSCLACVFGWEMPDCDIINCGDYGYTNMDNTKCICDPPHSGEFCTEFKKGDVLHYYNTTSKALGPIGAFAVIPMIMILIFCDRISKRRWSKKVERQLEATVTPDKDLDSDAIHKLLHNKH